MNESSNSFSQAIEQIHQHYGPGAIMKLGQRSAAVEIDGLSTGSLSLDLALGGCGLPRGRIIEIFGPEGSGKSTLCLSVVAAAQHDGGQAAYLDAEHALDPSYAARLGVDLDALYLSQPDSMEQALHIAEILVQSSECALVVVDARRVPDAIGPRRTPLLRYFGVELPWNVSRAKAWRRAWAPVETPSRDTPAPTRGDEPPQESTGTTGRDRTGIRGGENR
jgi:hypothetical protein